MAHVSRVTQSRNPRRVLSVRLLTMRNNLLPVYTLLISNPSFEGGRACRET